MQRLGELSGASICCPRLKHTCAFCCRTIYQSKLIEYDEDRNLAVFWARHV